MQDTLSAVTSMNNLRLLENNAQRGPQFLCKIKPKWSNSLETKNTFQDISSTS